MDTTFETITRTGFGPTRKTRKSAQREVDAWEASGSGTAYHYARRTNVTPEQPAHWEEIRAEVQPVDGGFVCAYITTITPTEA